MEGAGNAASYWSSFFLRHPIVGRSERGVCVWRGEGMIPWEVASFSPPPPPFLQPVRCGNGCSPSPGCCERRSQLPLGMAGIPRRLSLSPGFPEGREWEAFLKLCRERDGGEGVGERGWGRMLNNRIARWGMKQKRRGQAKDRQEKGRGMGHLESKGQYNEGKGARGKIRNGFKL